MKTLNQFKPSYLELRYSLSGIVPVDGSAESETLGLRLKSNSYRKAEALVVSDGEPLAAIEAIRTFIARGKLDHAEKLLSPALAKTSVLSRDYPELLLEKARIANARGFWSEAVGYCTEALANSTNSVSALTLHQIRSVAHFELNRFDLALLDLDNVQTLAELYPRGVSTFYSEALKIKISAHQGYFLKASGHLKTLWKKLN